MRILYYKGQGVEQSFKKTKEYYELAAKQKIPAALNYLGMLYYHGQGVEQNFEKAKEYFELAAKQKYPAAFNNLGGLYFEGKKIIKWPNII